MTEDQEKKITDQIHNGISSVLRNQEKILRNIIAARENQIEPTLVQAQHNGNLIVELREQVEKLQRRLAQLEQKVGQ
ncbi:MAG TPA: hypothetical protein PKD45_07440 [Flavobacteriales bacterium]|nr:hypothetical protein [Flavobacteriales bacterium]